MPFASLFAAHTLAYFAWSRSNIGFISAHIILVGSLVAIATGGTGQGAWWTIPIFIGVLVPILYWVYSAAHRKSLVYRWEKQLLEDIMYKYFGWKRDLWPALALEGYKAALPILRAYAWAYSSTALGMRKHTTRKIYLHWQSGQTYVTIELADTMEIVAGDDEGPLSWKLAAGAPLPEPVVRTLKHLSR